MDKLEYKPVPEDAIKLVLYSTSCDWDCCAAISFEIYAVVKPPINQSWNNAVVLWDSSTYLYLDGTTKELESLRKEVLEALEHYSIEPIDLEDDCVFDWEGELVL